MNHLLFEKVYLTGTVPKVTKAIVITCIYCYFYRSDVLDRGVKQLISQAVESKAKAFHTRIEGVVQNYLYMQNNPQKQDKQPRKHKMVDGKEETKLSTPEVISDISQLIPVPSSSSGTGTL